MALSAFNNSFHSTIKMTPFEAQFHRHSIQVSDVFMNNQLRDEAVSRRRINSQTSSISSSHQPNAAREHTLAQHKKKQYYEQFVHDKATFNIGDTVKINNFSIALGYRSRSNKSFLVLTLKRRAILVTTYSRRFSHLNKFTTTASSSTVNVLPPLQTSHKHLPSPSSLHTKNSIIVIFVIYLLRADFF